MLQGIFKILLLLLSCWIAGCGKANPKLPRLAPEAKVLAFGDSLTYGTGADAGSSYPAVLQILIKREVINAGVPGEISAEGRERLPGLLDALHPQLLLICHGGNDILRKLPKDQTIDNLRQMIKNAQERNIPVVLIGVPEFAIFNLKSAPYYQQLSKEFVVPIENEIIPYLEGKSSMKSDQIHFNQAGYRKLAEALQQLLSAHGAL
ncbi:acyl-CoA thioesterase I [Gammaproteobacteria bacterium]